MHSEDIQEDMDFDIWKQLGPSPNEDLDIGTLVGTFEDTIGTYWDLETWEN